MLGCLNRALAPRDGRRVFCLAGCVALNVGLLARKDVLRRMPFNWATIIKHNRAHLMRLVALVAAMLGEVPRGRLSPQTYHGILRQLRPLEAAARRLIVLAARGIEARPVEPRALPEFARGSRRGPSAFALFDRRLNPMPAVRRAAVEPRIRVIGEPYAPSVPPAERVYKAEVLAQRLARLSHVLENVPRHAKRLARWRLRHPDDLRRPMRPGRPPGRAERRRGDPVQAALEELQTLALYALAPD